MTDAKPTSEAADEHWPALTPYLIVKDATRAIEFYKAVFGATEEGRLEGPGGTVAHASLVIEDSLLMLAEESPAFGALSPVSVGGSPVNLHLYVQDVDRTVETAAAAGATVLRAVKDQLYGDRTAMIVDPFGHRWVLASRKDDVSYEEAQNRWKTMLERGGL